MVNAYLNWNLGTPSQITAVTPFTYRDGVTYLNKLEDLGDKVNEVIASANYSSGAIATLQTATDAKYTQLVADWNATLARLDPTAVRNIVTGYDTQIASLGTRVGAIETANYGAAITANSVADRAYADTKKTEAQAFATAADVTNLASAKAYTDTAKTAANGYTDTSINGLSSVYETKAALNGDIDSRVIGNMGSATAMRNALDARYAAQGSVAWPAQGNAGGVYYMSAYCNAAQKAGTASASPALAQILTEMSAFNNGKSFNGVPLSGGTIIVDGKYLIDQPISPPFGLQLIGTGTNSSGFYLSTGNFMQLGPGQWTEHVLCDGFGVDIAAGAGSFLKMTGTDSNNGSVMTKCNFRNLRIVTKSTSQPIVSVTGYSQYHSNHWFGFEMDRPTASTVGLFFFQPNAGNVMNSNSIRGCWLHGHNTTGNPAIYVGATAAGWQHNWTFEDICGEQNGAGLIMVCGVNHVQIRNCVDWDAAVAYTRSIIRVESSQGGTPCCNVVVESSGSPMVSSNATWDVDIANGQPMSQIRASNSCGLGGKVRGGDMTRIDNAKQPFRSVSSNYTVTPVDELLLAVAGGITITLPDPLTITNVATTYQILNLAAAPVTVVSANGRTVNGAASLSVPAGSSVSLITEGQYMSGSGAAMRWIRVAGS